MTNEFLSTSVRIQVTHLKNVIFYIISIFIASIFSITINESKNLQTYANERPQALEGLGITEHLGAQLNIHQLIFQDEFNHPIFLSEFFKTKKPVILTLVYYECPMLCNLLLNGVLDSIKQIDWNLGKQFEIITVSINPHENPKLAQEKKSTYLKNYNRLDAEKNWHFLTGEDSQIRELASEVGFKYRYDPNEKQFIHTAAIYIITPEGKISRYLYGTSFKPQNLKLSLLEASRGTIATSTLDQILLFCFHFDPNKNSYTLKIWRVIQLVICFQVLVLAGVMTYLWKNDKTIKQPL